MFNVRNTVCMYMVGAPGSETRFPGGVGGDPQCGGGYVRYRRTGSFREAAAATAREGTAGEGRRDSGDILFAYVIPLVVVHA